LKESLCSTRARAARALGKNIRWQLRSDLAQLPRLQREPNWPGTNDASLSVGRPWRLVHKLIAEYPSQYGKPCRSPAVAGKKRCRMYGGATGSGAPRGNTNALKHGRYTRVAIEERQQLRALLRQSRSPIQQIE